MPFHFIGERQERCARWWSGKKPLLVREGGGGFRKRKLISTINAIYD